MKQFKILTLLLVAFLTFACSNDDDSPAPEPTTQELLSGKWYLTSASNIEMNDCRTKNSLEFTNQDTLRAEYFSKINSGTCEMNDFMVFPYRVIDNDKTLQIGNEDNNFIIDITYISDSILIINENDISSTWEKKK